MNNITIQSPQTSRLSSVDFDNLPFGEIFSDHMFVADYRDGKWQDARVVPFAPITLSPSNLALHYGQSIFEGMKAFKDKDGKPMLFRPEQHAIRINKSAHRMSMPDIPEDLFMDAVNTLIGLDHAWIPPKRGSALYIRPFMFATDAVIGVRASKTYKFIIFTGPVGPYYSKPLNLVTADEYVRAVPGGVGEAKAAGNYAAAIYPTDLAHTAGFDQILWTDNRDYKYIQECGTMNVFFVIGDTVVTPNLNGAILKGITRDSLLTLLRAEGTKVEERPISIDELIEAHKEGKLIDAFGAGTAAVVSQIQSISYKENGEYVKMELPDVKSRDISIRLKKEINDIRARLAADPHGWMHEVKVSSPVMG